MKNFNYLHLSGFSALGLIVACFAQQWFGEHNPYSSNNEAYRSTSETIQAAQIEQREASTRVALLRDDRKKEESLRAKQLLERQKRDQAWQAFYVQPAVCQSPATNRVFTACADEHIRARHEFERAYVTNPGMLQPFRSTVATIDE